MHKYLFLLIFLCLPLWDAQVRAADSLGRLFLAPEQRAQLEIARAQRDRRIAPVIDAAPVVAAPRPSAPSVVTYNGIVNRSDGRSTVWINGQPVTERERVKSKDEINVTGVRRDGVVSVSIPQVDRRASLRVGQSLDVESGVIEESYRRRATARGAATPASAPDAERPATSTFKPRLSAEEELAAAAAKLLARRNEREPDVASDQLQEPRK